MTPKDPDPRAEHLRKLIAERRAQPADPAHTRDLPADPGLPPPDDPEPGKTVAIHHTPNDRPT